jgi:carboxyl-terminal processing protease
MRRLLSACVGAAALLALAGAALAEDAPDARPPASAEARWYLQYALDIMQQHSINRSRIDWPRFRASVMERARGAVTTADTHATLRAALSELGDGHSFLMTARPPAERSFAGLRERNPWFMREPRTDLIDGRFGYVAVPGFFRGTHAQQQEFAGRLQDQIRALDEAGVCGWIVDLRGNAGGNLWPMLAGIGPVLGDGTVASAVYPDNRRVPVWYRSGLAGFGDYVQLRVRGEAHELAAAQVPVAVLLGPATASSGETLAIAFRGRASTRSFGETTRGVSTGNRSFELSDGAVIALTVASTADRDGHVYGGAVEPEQPADIGHPEDPFADQPVVRSAIAWIETTAACYQAPRFAPSL